MTKTERLKRLAFLTSLHVYERQADRWDDESPMKCSCIVLSHPGYDGPILVMKDGSYVPFDFSELGSLIIANLLMQGPNWPRGWVVNPATGIVNISIHELILTIQEGQTWAEAVIAAMEDTHE
jgi:hypothetical protein